MWDNNLPTFDTQFSFFALIPFAGQLTKRFESGILLKKEKNRWMPDSIWVEFAITTLDNWASNQLASEMSQF